MIDAEPERPVAGYQGESGAFSETAVRALLGEVRTRGFRTFRAVIEALESGAIRYAVLPFHNSLHGPITQVRDLVDAHGGLEIAAEAEIRIEQCLIAMPGAQPDMLDCVASHPVALAQCKRFLGRHSQWKILESDDTAGAVREMMAAGRRASAAIGPAPAAQRYGASVLVHGIQDDPRNLTRFWLLKRTE